MAAAEPVTRPPSASVVSFIIPVRNDAVRLERCLRSIQMNVHRGAQLDVIVVDNGSSDDSATVAHAAGVRVIPVEGVRVSELRNIGAAHATGSVLAFIDADHEISTGWVAAALEALRADRVVAAGSLCHAPLDGTWVQRAYGALRGVPEGTHEVEWLGSGNLAVRRSAFEAVGGFDTTLTTCEDVDLCNRLRTGDARIISDARMKNVHYGDPATLWHLFKGELWRGQDNFRVSLRAPLTWRGLPSIVIPIVDVTMLVLGVVGLVAALAGWLPGLAVALAAALAVGAGATLRVARLVVTGRWPGPLGLLQAFAVACVYDLGRATALVTRIPHRNTRPNPVVAQ